MFAEKLDALMNIAEITNSQLGRAVNINSSHIGRLRSGVRALPKKHDYLAAMCRFLTGHIKKDYQFNALQKLTGIDSNVLASPENTALYMQRWLLEPRRDTTEASGRLISGFSRLPSRHTGTQTDAKEIDAPQKLTAYLYGNAGKRKAVEQFFTMILQEEKPQTLLLFSDENMAWLYEDASFAGKWMELFLKVIQKGNRIRIIHTISRDMNEMLEAIAKWVPVYMTGMVEPYYYPRLRDGIFQRTLFIAPDTAAVISSSVQQRTDGMLNLFLTDKAALQALTAEYEAYFSLCRPLMKIFTRRDEDTLQDIAESLMRAEGDAYLISSIPPLFTIPQQTIRELAEQTGDKTLPDRWEQSLAAFKEHIKKQHLTLVLPDPQIILLSSDAPSLSTGKLFSGSALPCTKEQYERNMEHLQKIEKQYENLNICFLGAASNSPLLYINENTGVIIIQSAEPQTAFVISERTMVSAFWDHMEKCVLN